MVASHPATLKLCDFLEGSQRCSAGEGGHWGDRPQILLFHHRPWVKIPYLSDCIGFWDDQYWPAIFALDLQKNQFREKVKPWVGRAQKYQLRKVDGFNFILDVLSPSSDGNWIIWATQWHKPTYIPFEMVYTTHLWWNLGMVYGIGFTTLLVWFAILAPHLKKRFRLWADLG